MIYFLFLPESDESLELILTDDAVSDMENSPKFVESEDIESLPKRQFKTAEIADAVMGTEAPIDPSDIESLFPKNVKDFQSGFSPPCDESSPQCGSPVVAAAGASLEETSMEMSQQVGDSKHHHHGDDGGHGDVHAGNRSLYTVALAGISYLLQNQI